MENDIYILFRLLNVNQLSYRPLQTAPAKNESALCNKQHMGLLNYCRGGNADLSLQYVAYGRVWLSSRIRSMFSKLS